MSVLSLATSTRTTWSQVEAGFFVANRAGEFIGYIDSADGGAFVAFDGTSAPLGRFATLSDAQHAVAGATRTIPPAQAPRTAAPSTALVAVAVGSITAAALAAAVIIDLIP